MAWIAIPAAAGPVARAALAAPVEEVVRGWLGARYSNEIAKPAIAIAVVFATVENAPIFLGMLSRTELWTPVSFEPVLRAADSHIHLAALYLLQPFTRIAVHAGLVAASIYAWRQRRWGVFAGVIAAHALLNAALAWLSASGDDLLAGAIFTLAGICGVIAFCLAGKTEAQN
ncbi:MAG: hypothetical protein RIA71_08490 [Oceanicaulis sp.]